MHRNSLQRAVALAILVALGLMALVPEVSADQVYHTEKVAFRPVGSAPLRDGFVMNIHPNGPQIYAHEVYTLKGAEPNTDYQITLLVHIEDPDCSSVPIAIPTATLLTNGAGNGNASVKLTPEDAAGLRNQTHGVAWTASTASDGVVYATACSAVTLD